MKIPPERFLTHTLQHHPAGLSTARILAATLAAVDPELLIKETFQLDNGILCLEDHQLDLMDFNRIILLGIGKAAQPMTLAAADVLGSLVSHGIILDKSSAALLPDQYRDRIIHLQGGHPFPDLEGMQAAQKIVDQLADLDPSDLVIILLSGGGSALLSLPTSDIPFQDLIETNRLLIGSGAAIQEVNSIRKHLSAVKGGRLARIIAPGKSLTLVLSDVIGDQLDSIASGPTVPDSSTFKDALEVVEKYQLASRLPPAILTHLKKGAEQPLAETPKPGDPLFQDHPIHLIGNNRTALLAAQKQARVEGFQTSILAEPLLGEAREIGTNMAQILTGMADSGHPLSRPACLIGGGETIVTLTDSPTSGIGGRNLELALAAVQGSAGLTNSALITLASDGEDGSSDACGAVVSGQTLDRARNLGLDPGRFLASHDSYSFFHPLGDLIQTGPTGTNVNDICLLITYREDME